MPKSLSCDLRERVIEAVEAGAAQNAAITLDMPAMRPYDQNLL
jgi:hypothetical protein